MIRYSIVLSANLQSAVNGELGEYVELLDCFFQTLGLTLSFISMANSSESLIILSDFGAASLANFRKNLNFAWKKEVPMR